MTDRYSPYDRAVALFSALAERPVQDLCTRPADLLRPLGRASATGYRAVAEAEAIGLLKHDAQQHYLRGLLARRIGFSALGFGDLADLVEPVLIDVRETLRLTTVFATIREELVLIGPYSLGRGSEYVQPAAAYRVVSQRRQGALLTYQISERNRGEGGLNLSGVTVRPRTDALCLLGVLVAGRRDGALADVEVCLRGVASLVAENGGAP